MRQYGIMRMGAAVHTKNARELLDDRKRITLVRLDRGRREDAEDVVAVEEPLTIKIDGAELVTLLYTPPLAKELALGYLASEGYITSIRDISAVTGGDSEVDVRLAAPVTGSLGDRVRVLTSGCGGGITFTYPKGLKALGKVGPGFGITAEEVSRLMSEFRTGSELFEATGGVHSAAIAGMGGIVASADDIGRHNAVDKVFGVCLKKGTPTSDKALLTTGRVSSEVLVKCVKRGLPVIVSRGAPTSLAVELAERFGITLIGFARGRRMNVYTHPERVSID